MPASGSRTASEEEDRENNSCGGKREVVAAEKLLADQTARLWDKERSRLSPTDISSSRKEVYCCTLSRKGQTFGISAHPI